MELLKHLVLATIFLILSGVGDAYGFTFVSRIWQSGIASTIEIVKTFIAFTIGIGSYVFAGKYLEALGITNPVIQMLIWLVFMLAMSAIINKSTELYRGDVIVAFACAVGAIGYIIFRTGG